MYKNIEIQDSLHQDKFRTPFSIVSGVKRFQNFSVLPEIFGTDMKVELLNDGPVTIVIDTKNKE